jgi:hypothetical protein
MSDERGVAAMIAEPGLLERHAAQNVIDEAAHLFDAPTCPRPNLRRSKVKHRDAVRLGATGDPPVETRIINQHHRVGLVMAKVAICHAGQMQELVQVEDRAQKPHHGQLRQVGVQVATGRGHHRSAVADKLGRGILGADRMDQVGAV